MPKPPFDRLPERRSPSAAILRSFVSPGRAGWAVAAFLFCVLIVVVAGGVKTPAFSLRELLPDIEVVWAETASIEAKAKPERQNAPPQERSAPQPQRPHGERSARPAPLSPRRASESFKPYGPPRRPAVTARSRSTAGAVRPENEERKPA